MVKDTELAVELPDEQVRELDDFAEHVGMTRDYVLSRVLAHCDWSTIEDEINEDNVEYPPTRPGIGYDGRSDIIARAIATGMRYAEDK